MPGLDEILVETDPAILWFKALSRLAGRLRQGHVVRELGDTGNAVGQIFTGCIDRPADASATFCLELARLQGERHTEPATAGSPIDVFELKPNFFGIGINLNHILTRIIAWWRRQR